MTEPDSITASWNVVATLPEDTFREACRLLGHWGKVERTHFYNVLTMQVADPDAFLHEFAAAVAQSPGIRNIVSHVVPAQRTFDFQTREEFEQKVYEISLAWLPELAGASFYVRLHRRGRTELIATDTEERRLGEQLLEALISAGLSGRVSFRNPDKVIQIETVDGRAGVSLWNREDLQRYPFLGVD